MKKRLAVALLYCFFINYNQAQINFVDMATDLGIGISCGDVPIGNGITFYDYNNDGWDDITLPTEAGQPIRFFRNNNGVFVEDFLNLPANTFQTKQVNWVDYDNDGDLDLFATSNVNGNKLYQNDGALNFTDVTVVSLLPTNNIFTYGASWGDYNNDGFLDVFLSNRDVAEVIPNYLYRNNGNGTFTNVSELAGILNTSNLSFCSAFFDFNNDGWQDIYVSNDRVNHRNVLYKNNGNGTFTDVSESSNTGLYIDAMSVTVDDYNADNYLDMYITNTPSGNVFLLNNGDGSFTNIANTNGTSFNSIAWGAVFLDAENDMDLDLYVSGLLDGTVSSLLSAAFYENDGLGNFSIPNNGFVNDDRESYSNAIGDVDNDGFSEIAVSNTDNDNIFIWKNTQPQTNNWLKVKLEGVLSNKQGIGSKIEISINGQKQYRYTLCGEGYLGQNSATEIFGLGTNTTIDYVRVYWLSGVVDEILNVSSNQVLNIQEGSNLLSIKNYDKQDFLCYPNPASDYVHLVSKVTIKSLKLYNELGQLIKTKEDINDYHYKLLLEGCNSGLYVVEINAGEEIFNYKFIKK
ncbi:FG-GAP-like repeat-containing protein [Psychroserpens sp. XS_ASV72]|uniref:FG-GAP-like repeat-containing protein n=1 Tax=Psychroserpens sp. XS_ASV72 TaxID=3241293 RepID=UPI003517463F